MIYWVAKVLGQCTWGTSDFNLFSSRPAFS
jgi:hypothetical protein